MKNDGIVGTAVTGLVVLALAPTVVGAVVNSASKCYSKVTNGFSRIKNTSKKFKKIKEDEA